jgi:hypothetical protein
MIALSPTPPAGSLGWYLGRKIVPLRIELRPPLDIRRSFGSGSGRVRRIHQMGDGSWNRWNPSKFPWFTNEFAHPGELKAV